ncbi:hypothetical protein DESA109040_03295 [Deinococcus saxicola]
MVTGALALALGKTNILTLLMYANGKDTDSITSSAYKKMLGTRLDLTAFLREAH